MEIGPYVWGGPSYAWAPDGRTIAVHHVDRRAVRQVPFPHYLGPETDPNLVRRSYPGDRNEDRRVGLYELDTGELTLLDLPDPAGVRIVDFAWSPDGRLLIDRESDTAVDRWLDIVEPTSGRLQALWHDHRETRVYTSCGSAWHPDGEHVVALGDLADRPVTSYRAGGFCIEPFRRIAPLLAEAGIFIDSSVVPGARLDDSSKGFDFSSASDTAWWRFDDSPLVPVEDGPFVEVAITPLVLPFTHYWGRLVERLKPGPAAASVGDGVSKAIGKREIRSLLLSIAISTTLISANNTAAFVPFGEIRERLGPTGSAGTIF